MKTISIGTLKGGTGKTTITFNLAGALAENSKVLMLDVDPQCNLSNNAGINIANANSYSSKDIFSNESIAPQTLVVKNPIPSLPNLDIIPSNIFLIETELNLINRAARESVLANYIEENRDFFEQYDYILIDTNPSMGPVNQNAFTASDSIILVSDVDNNSRIGVELFMFLWKRIAKAMRIENNIRALILNRADVRTTLTGDLWEYYRDDEDLSAILVEPAIREKIAFRKAAINKIPVTQYKEGKESAREIYELIDALKARGVF